MDADVVITIVFVLEVVLFSAVATAFMVHGFRKARREAVVEDERDRVRHGR